MPFISSIRRDHRTPKNTSDWEITGGDVVYTAGGYRIHMFTSPGAAELSIKNKTKNDVMYFNGQSLDVEFLVVGGGGGGGTRHGGGGGAGGMVVGSGTTLNANSYNVFVGSGGARRTGDAVGFAGQDSQFSSVTALGGGGGGHWNTNNVGSGGSGGGSGGPSPVGGTNNSFGSGQQGNTPLSGTGFGFPGGAQHRFPGPGIRSGGGGGAGGKGEDGSEPAPDVTAGVGGPGRQNSILGTNYYWAGGGGGTGWNNSRGAPGGLGGGGGGTRGTPGGLGGTGGLNDGQDAQPAPGDNAFRQGGDAGANTGSGGGGGLQSPSTGGAGGSGIVVVRYPR